MAALALAGWGWSASSRSGTPAPVVHDATRPVPIAAASVPTGAIDYQALDARFRRLAGEKEIAGFAVGIVEGGEIRFLQGYGETTEGSGDPVTPNTVFRWASLSKGVAGSMVARLADQQKVSLSAPVARYSATLRLPAGAEQRATVADLLSHQLGIFSHAEDGKLEDGADPRMLRAGLAHLSLICAPGQCHAYQNVAYDAASDVVEKATGRSYQAAVAEQLFAPLGMASATMTRDGLVTARSWARPHVGGLPKATEVLEPYYRVPAAGGVNSSIKDLALWMQAQMGLRGAVLSPGALAMAQTPFARTPGELGRMRKFRERLGSAEYGLGWRLYDYAGHRIVAHRGGVRGYRSLIMFDPVLKTGVVALWNSSTARPGAIEYEVMDMAYRLPFKDWLELDKAAVG